MGHSVGEETLIEKRTKKTDAAYAQSETYLLDFDHNDLNKIKTILMQTGNRSDYLLIDNLIKKNYY